ncbi:Rib/alpha-like domain-containing protein [Limosilactobacillus reuteri]|uniref:Rib/alpha-like domain-containing protein n=1 Tax=Limosilactobacillus reuteri TaxID=1598 RepID=UPI0020747959|nr:Rib/alpha-like domain-containing protein [Limosilactobacillus reuteri]
MNKEFQTLRKKQRFGLRKLNIGVASVLLGFTIFGYNLTSQAPVAHAATVATSAVSGASGGGVSGSGSAATASQATPATQVTVSAASQSSAPANSGNATSSPASQAGTVSANHTAIGTTPSSQTVSVNETTSSATQARTLMMNLASATQARTLMTNLAVINPDTAENTPNSGTDTKLPTTTQTYDKVKQPLLYDYLLHTATGTRDGQTWVDKTLAKGKGTILSPYYRSNTLDTIFGTTLKQGIITKNPDKYFFAAYVDFSEQYHRVILLARSQTPSDKSLYSYTIHTFTQNTSTTTTKPGDSNKEQYTGAGGSTYDLIFHNYGDSFTVKLNDFNGKWGMLPVFDEGLLDPTYGSNTLEQNDKAAQTEPISFWASAIPQETSTKVRYVDQATGKDIVQPMEISGFGYQGFKVKGDAPTVTGYKLVSKPKFLGLPYEDGTIAPYKVWQTYDLALSDSVVIKQTVIDTDGTVRATAYYKGSRIPSMSASKVLGRESYNDYMSFYARDGKSYAYTNRIGQVDGSYIYYYAKDSDPKGSDMRLHFIDVTGVNNSSYAPSDGPELDADKVQTIHGNIGENYNFTYTVPKGYDQVATSDVTGTYSKTHHDAYVYVKKQAENSDTDLINAKAGNTPDVPRGVESKQGDEAPAGIVVAKDKDDKDTTFPKGTKVTWETAPDVTNNGQATGKVTVTYPDKTTDTVDVTVNVVPSDADKNEVKAADGVTTNLNKVPAAKDSVTVTDPDKKPVTDFGANWTKEPDVSKPGKSTGTVEITYPDGSKETVEVPVTVRDENGKTQADKNDAKATDGLTTDLNKVPAAKDSVTVTDPDKKPVTDFGANWTKEPDVSKPGKSTGTVEITYPDGSKETVEVPVTVRDENGKTQADKNDAKATDGLTTDLNKVPAAKDSVTVTDPDKKPVTDFGANWTKEPDVSKPGKSTGTVEITYPDGSKETVEVPVTVRDENGKTQADKNDAKATDGLTTDLNKVPAAKDSVTVTDPDKKPVTDFGANWTKEPDVSKPGKSTGTVEITYPDGSKETVEVPVTVRDENGKTQADKNDAKATDGLTTDLNKVPAAKDSVTVTDPDKKPVTDFGANWTKEPDVSKPGKSTGTVEITYPDGSKETVEVPVTVRDENGKTQADKNDAKATDGLTTDLNKVPAAKDSVTVTDPDKKPVTDFGANWTKEPDVSKPGKSTGTVEITYPDGSKETVEVPVTVRDENGHTQADTNTPEAGKVTVNKGETPSAQSAISNNKELPEGTQYDWKEPIDTTTPGDKTGTVVVTYPDGSSEEVPGVTVHVNSDTDLINAKAGNTPDVPRGVEIKQGDEAPAGIVVAKDKDDKDTTFPEGTKVTWETAPDVTNNGQATGKVTVTYPDKTTDTVDVTVKVVPSDADKNEVKAADGVTTNLNKVPAAKDSVTVTDPDKKPVTDFEANWTKEPDVSKPGKSTGTVEITYPDGSKETVEVPVTVRDANGHTQADKNDPKTPGNKVKVDDPTKLTDGEKEDVVKAVEDANKDDNGNSTLPDGTKITVGDNGDVTVTYPDGSKDTIPGDKVVEGKTDADKTDVTVPGTKVEVGDPTKLTDGEKGQVEEAIKDANPNLPDGTKITVADDGTATILYPDGSYKVIDGQDLVTKPGQTTADQVTPVVPGDKVTVVDPNHLTDAEKDQVKTNVEKANQNNFPAGTVVMVADDGTATITYPDGSVDQISAADLITKPMAAGQAGKGTGTTTTNGQGAPAGQGKADQAKTLPQTGNEQGSLLAASGLGMLLLGMLGLGGKRKKED